MARRGASACRLSAPDLPFLIWPGAPIASGSCPLPSAIFRASRRCGNGCSLVTRIGRFHAPVRDIPASYLRTVLSGPSTSLVAVHGRLVQWQPWPPSFSPAAARPNLACWWKTPGSAAGPAANLSHARPGSR